MAWWLQVGIGVVVGAVFTAAIVPRRGAPTPRVEPTPPLAVDRVSASPDERVLRAVETISMGVVLYNEEGDQVFANPSALGMGGSRHQRPLVEAVMIETATAAATDGRHERILELFGPPRQVLEFSGEAIVVDGRPAGVVVTVEDVTDQHRSIEMRRDFVANVSHELKTPVGAMALLAETLIDADDADVVERLGHRLHHEALRLGRTIDDLLALAELESGTARSRDRVDTGVVIGEAIERCAVAADLGEVTITTSPDETSDGRPVILGDRRQLVAAVTNLIDNAIKYSEAGAEVRVSAALAPDDPSTVCLAVADSGIGIPPADRERIFERFYRVDPARSRHTGGTGLGLSIVRHVAINHDGRVALDSVEGEGSTFRLLLPAAPISSAHDTGIMPSPGAERIEEN